MTSGNVPSTSGDQTENTAATESSFKIFYKMLAEAYQPTEFRSNVKLWGSGLLAVSLWILVGSIAWNQLQTNRDYATKLADLTPELVDKQISLVHQTQVEQIEKSVVIIDSTADRLYTFFAPIITAVTGYFFVSAGARPRSGPPSETSADN